MPNPTLTAQVFERQAAPPEADETGWASPTGPAMAPPAPPADRVPTRPYGGGPTPPLAGADTMRLGGVVSAAGVLTLVLIVAGWFGWQTVTVTETIDAAGQKVSQANFPAWILPGLLVGLGVAFLTAFKPQIARFTAPLYAILEGLVLGAISHVYESQFDGIVLQAVTLTIGVFLTMLFLYGTRIIKVTNRLRTGIIAATFGVLLAYGATLLLSLFGASVPFIHDAGPIGIGFSLLVVGIAAFNLLLDFDIIERGVQVGAPRYMEWYGAFALLVSLVWLYLELLRLLAKLRR